MSDDDTFAGGRDRNASAILDTFGESHNALGHDYGAWNNVGKVGGTVYQERICFGCGHREFRRVNYDGC